MQQSSSKALVYGSGFVLLGGLTIVSLLLAENAFHPHGQGMRILFRLIEDFGLASISIGVVGIVLSFRDWQNYFRERIADTVTRRDYLKKLNKQQLTELQSESLRAYYELDSTDPSKSFLEYFNKRIRDFIATPYREDLLGKVIIHDVDGNDLKVTETHSFRCRAVKGEIQKEVSWTADTRDLILIEEFSVRLDDGEGNVLTYKKGDAALQAFQGGHGWALLVPKEMQVDGLRVLIEVGYVAYRHRPFSWAMAHPTNHFTGIIKHPDDCKLVLECLGVLEQDTAVKSDPGLTTVKVETWLLPFSGFYFYFLRQEPVDVQASTADRSAPTLQPPTNP